MGVAPFSNGIFVWQLLGEPKIGRDGELGA